MFDEHACDHLKNKPLHELTRDDLIQLLGHQMLVNARQRESALALARLAAPA